MKVLKKNQLLLGSILILFIYTALITILHGNSIAAFVTVSRLLIEQVLGITILYFLKPTMRSLTIFFISFGVVNSIAIFLTIADKVYLSGSLGVSESMENLWGVHHDPTRSAGLFPSYQSSGLLILLSLYVLNRSSLLNDNLVFLLGLVFVLALFFGSRFFLFFALLLFLKRNISIRNMVYFMFISIFTIVFFQKNEIISYHVEQRIVPLIKLTQLEKTSDQSMFYMIESEWNMPIDDSILLIGNGHKKYDKQGGGDTLFFKWLYYGGILSVFGIYLVIFFKMIKSVGISRRVDVVLVWLAIFASTLKSEAFTSVGFFLLLSFLPYLKYGHYNQSFK
jgi:hypothetical protein